MDDSGDKRWQEGGAVLRSFSLDERGNQGKMPPRTPIFVVPMPLLCPSDLGHRSRSGTLCLIEPGADICSINQDLAGVALKSSQERWQFPTQVE